MIGLRFYSIQFLIFLFCSVGILFFSRPGISRATDEYSFDLDEFEKKRFEWGGYAEFKWEHSRLNQDGSLYFLKYYDRSRSTFDRLSSSLQLDGSLNKDVLTFNWRVQAMTQQDDLARDYSADIFEAYASLKPTPKVTIDMGKKVSKWGKGYAWNPVAFISRPKDPDNPEEALEGFIGAGVDLIKSYSGSLQTIALTGVILPVYQNVNEDFGEPDNINLAAKLYLLYQDTDIDFLFYTGNSRSTRYGVDFSKNLATNFEIHGEFAYTPEQTQKVLDANGSLVPRTVSDTSYLLGMRYLSTSDITTIIEFYHNGLGYSQGELQDFFQLAADGYDNYLNTGSNSFLKKAGNISRGGYGKPQSGRNYLYTRILKKEPFGILYVTPAVTLIANLDDESYSISPEIIYTGITNFELRLKFSYLDGNNYSEYGEKINQNKFELRMRYFF